MSGDEDFARELRDRADATVPVIPVDTAWVLPRARRRRAVTRAVGALAAVAVLGGAVWTAGAFWPGRTPRSPGVASSAAALTPVSAERRAGLFGMWRVDAGGEGPDTWLRLAGSASAVLWRDCGVLDASWAVGPTAFVAFVYGWSGTCGDAAAPPAAPWLDAAVAYRADGDGWQLLDATGAVTATLRHDGAPAPRPDVADDEARPPVVDDAARQWVSDPAPVPAGPVPATRDAVLGRWVPSGSPVPNDPFVQLSDDGTWTASDGCNRVVGRWAVDAGGRIVVVGGAATAMGCDGAPLPGLLVTARRAAVSGGDLLLFDGEGAQVARLTRDGSAPSAPVTVAATATADASATEPVAVSCTAAALAMRTGPLVVTGAGLRLVVRNDGAPDGTYLDYRWGGGYGGGDELSAQPTHWQLQVPPGQLELWCSSDLGRTEWGHVTLTVTDPDGWWDATTIQNLGCPGAAAPSWAFGPAGGASPREAVENLAPSFQRPGTTTVERAEVGYPDAPSQTWFVLEDGAPYAVVQVRQSGDGFEASPDVLCAAPGGR